MSIIGTRPPLISETNLYELHHGLIHLESFWEDGDYMKMESLQQNL